MHVRTCMLLCESLVLTLACLSSATVKVSLYRHARMRYTHLQSRRWWHREHVGVAYSCGDKSVMLMFFGYTSNNCFDEIPIMISSNGDFKGRQRGPWPQFGIGPTFGSPLFWASLIEKKNNDDVTNGHCVSRENVVAQCMAMLSAMSLWMRGL